LKKSKHFRKLDQVKEISTDQDGFKMITYYFKSDKLPVLYRWIFGSHTINVLDSETKKEVNCFSANYEKNKLTKADIMPVIKRHERDTLAEDYNF
tara:strand:- start:398 stop:682 length:285 start_codon:yes stop_codon:yes gene_type:complete